MKHYRKRPLVVQAQLWDEATGHPAVRIGIDPNTGGAAHYIDTVEGPIRVSPGDWIIIGTHGEPYPCKPDIFKMVYEPVEELSTSRKARATHDQRALAWILCRDLAAQLKEREGGDLTADDLHDYFLLERFGERERVIYGRVIRRPAKTFSQLSKLEMSDMIDFIIQWARTMQLSVTIPADRSYQEMARDASQ